ncbi:hypothetical protein LZ30DRAFT_823751 [Colletotrichum cereale]|nr:hypothetical protein LZ30DRAFT_823751 [Colletotrichum cereale]
MIQEIYSKIERYFKKIAEIIECVRKIVSLIKSKSWMDDVEFKDSEGLYLPAIKGDDAINITADWDVFQAEMNTLSDGIKNEHIGGADDFYLLISKMMIRSKAIFTAQPALTSASDARLTVVQQHFAQTNHTDRLRKTIPQIQGNEKAFGVIKLAMAERLLTLRTWIALDFRQYLAAYAWNRLPCARPILLDPMKDIGSFRNDAATLQALSAQARTDVRAKRRIFRFSPSPEPSHTNGSTVEGVGIGSVIGFKKNVIKSKSKVNDNALVHSEEFLNSLRNSRTFSFSIDCEHALSQRYGRLRIRRTRVFLDGAVTDEESPVSIRVTLSA